MVHISPMAVCALHSLSIFLNCTDVHSVFKARFGQLCIPPLHPIWFEYHRLSCFSHHYHMLLGYNDCNPRHWDLISLAQVEWHSPNGLDQGFPKPWCAPLGARSVFCHSTTQLIQITNSSSNGDHLSQLCSARGKNKHPGGSQDRVWETLL
jgi:hypothetical protein